MLCEEDEAERRIEKRRRQRAQPELEDAQAHTAKESAEDDERTHTGKDGHA
jgi:hypothetical protein